MVLSKIYAVVDYEDSYVQPLLLEALKAQLPTDLLIVLNDVSELPTPSSRLLQWRQYEKIDFDHLTAHRETSLANSYVFRKALIRKHYLSNTVTHWLSKNPASVLKHHVKPAIDFELDYAEFLDDALVEAFELKDSWARNDVLESNDARREWWVLKPGMSDRGQGIRLFSSEDELQAIFEEWEPSWDGESNEGSSHDGVDGDGSDDAHGIVVSQLRHFVAQPYIYPPLLLPSPHPACGRKFHVRTYVLAVGAVRVYVYKPMLALFAGKPYQAPSSTSPPNEDLAGHLTNTCLQSGDREGNVRPYWSLPSQIPGLASDSDWREHVFAQICAITGEIFEAAARSMSVHFQPLPNAFEIYGLDFLVDANATAWLLEVNAFPDFAQTGKDLEWIIRGLFDHAVSHGVLNFFKGDGIASGADSEQMIEVLDIDLGRK